MSFFEKGDELATHALIYYVGGIATDLKCLYHTLLQMELSYTR